MQNQKAFLYMYPQKDILDFETRNHSWYYNPLEIQMEFEAREKETSDEFELSRLKEEYSKQTARLFRTIYSEVLNKCIDIRYRKNGFRIFYALLDNTNISDLINLQKGDRMIYVGMDEKTHRTPNSYGNYPYPNSDFVLNQLGAVNRLVVSGFHLNDCVKKIARRAYLRGINVLVDEELSELFGWNFQMQEFDPEKYPSINPELVIKDPEFFKEFNTRRLKKPWLYQWT